MKPRGVDCSTHLGLFCALALMAALFPRAGYAHSVAGSDLGPVRFVDVSSPYFKPSAEEPPLRGTAFKLGEVSRGSRTLNLSLTPYAALSSNAAGDQRVGGAELRLAAQDVSGEEPNGAWFAFAGAKGKAVTWEMNDPAFSLGEFAQLKRRATVGDFQAGVGYQLGSAQMSLGYVRRTYKSGDLSDHSSFAAISFAWRN